LSRCDGKEPFIVTYFRKNETRAALNVPDDIRPWKECMGGDYGAGYNYTIHPAGSIAFYSELTSSVRILFFSGDKDSAVPGLGT